MRRSIHDFTRSETSLKVIGLVNTRGLVPIRMKAKITGCVNPTAQSPIDKLPTSLGRACARDMWCHRHRVTDWRPERSRFVHCVRLGKISYSQEGIDFQDVIQLVESG